MQMDAGLDTGPMIDAFACRDRCDDTAGSLTARLAEVGAAAIVATLGRLARRRDARAPRRSPTAGATYAPKIAQVPKRRSTGRPAPRIERASARSIRRPGATAVLAGLAPVKLWRAEVAVHA